MGNALDWNKLFSTCQPSGRPRSPYFCALSYRVECLDVKKHLGEGGMGYEQSLNVTTDQAAVCRRPRPRVLPEGQLQGVPTWVTSCPHDWTYQPWKRHKCGKGNTMWCLLCWKVSKGQPGAATAQDQIYNEDPLIPQSMFTQVDSPRLK